jgi:hypothetical protein
MAASIDAANAVRERQARLAFLRGGRADGSVKT